MKITHIVRANQKGQVVIPKEVRRKLAIGPDTHLTVTVRGDGVYLSPVSGVLGSGSADSYRAVLERTKGAWKNDSWEKTRAGRKKTEISASEQRRKAW